MNTRPRGGGGGGADQSDGKDEGNPETDGPGDGDDRTDEEKYNDYLEAMADAMDDSYCASGWWGWAQENRFNSSLDDGEPDSPTATYLEGPLGNYGLGGHAENFLNWITGDRYSRWVEDAMINHPEVMAIASTVFTVTTDIGLDHCYGKFTKWLSKTKLGKFGKKLYDDAVGDVAGGAARQLSKGDAILPGDSAAEAAAKAGVTIPTGYVPRRAKNNKGWVWQHPDDVGGSGTKASANILRVAEPTPLYPKGYVRYYNREGQAVTQKLTKKGNLQTGSQSETHFRVDGDTSPPPGWPVR